MSRSGFSSNNSHNISQHFHRHSRSNDLLEDRQAAAASAEQVWGHQQTIKYNEPSRSSADVASVQQNTFQLPRTLPAQYHTSTISPMSEVLHCIERSPLCTEQRLGGYIRSDSFLGMLPGPPPSEVTRYLLHDEHMAAHGAQYFQFPENQGRFVLSPLTFPVRHGEENFIGPSPPRVDAFSSMPMNDIQVNVGNLSMNRGTESLQVQSNRQQGTLQSSVSPRHDHIKALIAQQRWLRENKPEPKLDKEAAAARYGIQTDEFAGSVFDVFINVNGPKSFQCKWPYGRCIKEFTARYQARHHLHTHFHYQPFACGGKCRKSQWQVISSIQRYPMLI